MVHRKISWYLAGISAFTLLLVVTVFLSLFRVSPTEKTSLSEEASTNVIQQPSNRMATEESNLFSEKDDLLDLSTNLDEFGRVPFVETTNPGILAEAYTRFSMTMDTKLDSLDGWLEARDEWSTNFIPRGFNIGLQTASEHEAWRDLFAMDWEWFAQMNAVIDSSVTGVYLNQEILNAPRPSGFAAAPDWLASIPTDTHVYLVRTSWQKKFIPSERFTTFSNIDGYGNSEMLIVCPGTDGFHEHICKVVDSTNRPTNFLTFRLNGWPN